MLCVFDVNETLLDLGALDEFFAGLTGDGHDRVRWFDLMIHNALVLTASRQYRTFGEIAAACLPAIAPAATPEHQRELGARLSSLPAHPDSAEAITRLRDAGHRVVTLTNSTLEVAEKQLNSSGLRPLLDAVYSADQVRLLKPAAEPYRLVTETEQAQGVLIAAHGWDVAGAAAAGLHTAFVAREGRSPLPAAETPEIVGNDLLETADRLIDAFPAGS